MRVLFSVCGMGLGHAARMLPVATMVRKSGTEVIFSTYGPAFDAVRANGFDAVQAPAVSWAEDSRGAFSPLRTLAKGPFIAAGILRQAAFENGLFRSFKPDVIVADGRYSTLLARNRKRIPCVFVTNQPEATVPHGSPFHVFKRAIDASNAVSMGAATRIAIPDNLPPHSIAAPSGRLPAAIQGKCVFTGLIRPSLGKWRQNFSAKTKIDIISIKRLIGSVVSGGSRRCEASRQGRGAGGDHRIASETMFPGRDFIAADEPDSESRLYFPWKKKSNILVHLTGPGRSGSSLSRFIGRQVARARRSGVPGADEIGVVLPWQGLSDPPHAYKQASMVVTRAGFSTLSTIALDAIPAMIVPVPEQWEQQTNASGMATSAASLVGDEAHLRTLSPSRLVAHLLDARENLGASWRAASRREHATLSGKTDGARSLVKLILEESGRFGD